MSNVEEIVRRCVAEVERAVTLSLLERLGYKMPKKTRVPAEKQFALANGSSSNAKRLHGAYLGLYRHAKRNVRTKAKKLKNEKGTRAAVVFLKAARGKAKA